MSREPIHTDKAPAAIGPYSQAVLVDKTLYISGQIPLDPQTMQLVTGIENQIQQVFFSLKMILESAQMDLNDVVKLNVFLTDLAHFGLINETMQSLFNPPYPARAAIQVSALPRDASVEIDAIAVKTQACVIKMNKP